MTYGGYLYEHLKYKIEFDKDLQLKNVLKLKKFSENDIVSANLYSKPIEILFL